MLCAECGCDLRQRDDEDRLPHNIPAPEKPNRIRLVCGRCCNHGLTRWRPWPSRRGSRHDRAEHRGAGGGQVPGGRDDRAIGLLNDAEHYAWGTSDQRLAYLERRAKLLHRLVDATGDESSRYLAQDAEDRAAAARAGAAA
ncbi:hypothetical protein AB0N87_42080 [Streptomyces sp. NPDC093228]|uniref:hypothetical protein n=1 Tax=Streptomyces sp. NPDC093228 TaxID=3155070 RepID=UPI0034477F85